MADPKFIKDPGIPRIQFEMGDESGPDFILTMRASEATFVIEGSAIRQCAECGHDVYISPNSPQDWPCICLRCVPNWLDASKTGVQ